MLAMNDGEYYRLVKDITINANDFKMITAKPAMFDGNGYNIIINQGATAMEVGASSAFALFQSNAENCIIKNVNIIFTGSLTMTLNNSLKKNMLVFIPF